jgi:hypothetical protein
MERFSSLKNLHENFKKEANSINFPKFPPKKFFGSTDEKFLNQRQTALEHYFNTILGSKEFSNIPSLKKWVDEMIKKYNRSSNIEKGKTFTNQIEKQEKNIQQIGRTDSNSGANQNQHLSFAKNNGK